MFGNWQFIRDGNPHGRWLYERHYSASKSQSTRRTRRPALFVGPGEKLVLMTSDGLALFVWRKFIDDTGQTGVNCAIFRNEGYREATSSELILEAEQIAWTRWPGARLYTFVNDKKILSINPGYCFKKAGWKLVRDIGPWCGKRPLRTESGLLIFEKLPA